jgi:hypothetical protein
VTAITGCFGNFAAGAFADRGSLRTVLVAALLIRAGGLLGLAHVSTFEHVRLRPWRWGSAAGS